MNDKKEQTPFFSVTASDCRFDYYRGSGKGGQKRNKTSSAVRCTHLASGAVGQSEDGRSQAQNKKTAFSRMAETKKFKIWLQMEFSRKAGIEAEIEAKVDREMREHNLLIEGKTDDGKWEKIE